MASASESFFRLPELLSHLPPFLTRRDLTRLLLTNRAINAICTPVFWQVLSATGAASDRLLKSPEGLKALSNNIESVQFVEWNVKSSWFYINALWIHLNNRTSPAAHRSIPTDALSHSSWGELLPPGDDESSILPALPPMLRLTRYRGFSSSQVPERTFRPEYSDKAHIPHQHQIMWLLRLNSATLTHLCLLELPLLSVNVIRDVCRTISQLKHLKALQLTDPTRTSFNLQVIRMLFFSCPCSLVEFTLSGTLDIEKRDMNLDPEESEWDYDQGPLVLRQEPLHHLKSIKLPLVENQGEYSAHFLHAIFQHCPALENLTLPSLGEQAGVQDVPQVIGDCCPGITDLTIPLPLEVENEDPSIPLPMEVNSEIFMNIMERIQAQRLKNLRVHKLFDMASSPLSDVAFARHSKTLRQIEFLGCQQIHASTFKSIFESCCALEVLIASDNYRRGIAYDLDEKSEINEWACTRLRHLVLTVFLTSDGRDPKYLADPTMATWTEKDRNHWRMLDTFYTRIGSLKELQVLTLRAAGTELKYGWRLGDLPFREACLPGLLALEDTANGKIGFLSKWEGLTKLREVRGSFSVLTKEVSARMGKREVDWLATHLPALRLISLWKSGYTQSLPDDTSPKIVRDLKQLRPELDFIELW
ncbi:MAG: hypothetical protein J3R72DRAFT_431045 [Linnemannia gamsii]|nr:MAG: hypothetical protein J3R72DRAFT_431045 [Linnemannia gamsii]